MTRAAAILLAGLLGLVTPLAAWAEGVGTLSAAGPNRLFVDAWPANGWSVKRYENLVEITFPSSGFELAGASDLASALGPSVEQVEVETREADSILRLTLACSCPIALDGDGANRLTISVVDTQPVSAVATRSGGSEPAPSWAPKPPMKPKEVKLTETSDDEDGVLDVDEARARLLEQLMRAAEAGIVELDPESELAEAAKAEEEMAAAAEEAASADAPMADDMSEVKEVAEPDSTSERMATEEVAPEDKMEPGEAKELIASEMPAPLHPAQCFETAEFLLPEFPTDPDFLDALSRHRAGLIGEFDRPDPKVALDLARSYLSVGMTAEARAVATDFGMDKPEAQLVREIADVVDGTVLGSDASLLKSDCDSDQALWRAAALASGDDSPDSVLAAELVSGRALERLPVFLRETVASRIGSAAVDAADWDTARRMEAMALRAASGRPELQGETLLLSARLADWNEDADKAWDYRQRALQTGPPFAEKALLELAETVLSSEKFLGASTDSLRLDLGTLALQARGTPLGERAFELEARLLARSQGRDELIELLAESERSQLLPEDKQVSLLSELVEDSQLDSLSRPVGLIYLDDPERFADAMDQPAFRRAVVRSLADLGLPGLAEPLLRAEDQEVVSLHAAVSSSFLASGDGRSALNVAQEMSPGLERDAAIATALAALGQTDQAAGMLDRVSEGTKSETRLAALERAVDAAANAGDMAMAIAASSKLLAAEPTRERAEEHVMLALLAGEPALPRDALQVLQETAPDRVDQLKMLFASQEETTSVDQHARAEETLERMDIELELLEGLLGDG